MALKGRTRIELTNVETGEVEVHEDNNMVTNALSKLLGNYGWFANNALSYAIAGSSDDGVIKKLTCGLMLFDSEIEENPDIINAPAGVSVVGCGSATAYNGANIMAGSYNETESGWTDDGGYKHVWDFSTSQANGEIACASLTTNAGGKITEGTYPYSSDYFYGVGTKVSNEVMFFDEDVNRNRTVNLVGFNGNYNYWLMFADGINNRIIAPLTNEEIGSYNHSGVNTESYEKFKNSVFYKKSIDLALYRFGFTNFSIFDSAKDSRKTKLLEVKTVEMPDGLKNVFNQEMLDDTSYYWKVGSVSDENNIYIILSAKQSSSNNIEVGQTFYIWEINATTFESKYYEFYNALDESIYMYNLPENKIYNYFSICDEHVLCVGESSSCVYIINKNNSYNFEKVTYPDGSQLRKKLSESQHPVFNNCGKFIFKDNENPYKVVDPITKKAMYKNKNLFKNCTGNVLKVKGTHYFCEGSYMNRDGTSVITMYLDPTLLVTINNLETPVQKTSAQTMKVTYILTQE